MGIAGDRQHRIADRYLALGEDLVDGAADHLLDELVGIGVADQPFADHLAVAKHRIAVGDAEDLVELVADEEDRLAVAPSACR